MLLGRPEYLKEPTEDRILADLSVVRLRTQNRHMAVDNRNREPVRAGLPMHPLRGNRLTGATRFRPPLHWGARQKNRNAFTLDQGLPMRGNEVDVIHHDLRLISLCHHRLKLVRKVLHNIDNKT